MTVVRYWTVSLATTLSGDWASQMPSYNRVTSFSKVLKGRGEVGCVMPVPRTWPVQGGNLTKNC